jgi:hypothetical protein
MTYDIGATAALGARVSVAMALLSIFGVAVGAAVTNRTVALVAVIAWFALAEDLVGGALHVRRFVPGAAVRGLVSAGPGTTSTAIAVLLLLAFVLAATAAATTALRHDVA